MHVTIMSVCIHHLYLLHLLGALWEEWNLNGPSFHMDNTDNLGVFFASHHTADDFGGIQE